MTTTTTGSGRDNQIAPFLSKCYTMVDDPSTDSIISWGSFNTSFIIWDVITFEQELLPKYYKHKNMSSFIRQLNQYGFKKYEPDRWEFINDGFVKGQRHMLKNIRRKKTIQGNYEKSKSEDNNTSARKNSSKIICQQNQSQGTNPHMKTDLFQSNSQQNRSQGNITSTRIKSSQGNTQQNDSQENNTFLLTKPSQANERQNQLQESNTSGECVQVAEFRLWQDVENLKKDKNVVMQELAKLSHYQQGADGKLHSLGQRLQGMEISQQQLLSFLAMVVQSPGFLVKLLQQNETTWCISETNKKRPYLALEQDTDVDEPVACDGQIVKYQPPIHEMPKPLLTSSLSWDESQPLDPSANGLDDFFKNIDLMSSGEGMQVPMEENGNSVNEGQFIISDSLEDGTMENLLLAASELLEDDETTGPNSAEVAGNSVDPDPTDDNSSDEPSQALDRFTEELELLLLETNNEDG